jgi:hypothetical protein
MLELRDGRIVRDVAARAEAALHLVSERDGS